MISTVGCSHLSALVRGIGAFPCPVPLLAAPGADAAADEELL